jgi:hypothetical protein
MSNIDLDSCFVHVLGLVDKAGEVISKQRPQTSNDSNGNPFLARRRTQFPEENSPNQVPPH